MRPFAQTSARMIRTIRVFNRKCVRVKGSFLRVVVRGGRGGPVGPQLPPQLPKPPPYILTCMYILST